MSSSKQARRRVRLGDDGLVHVRTRRYTDELLTTHWEELAMTPEEALAFFRSGMIDVLRLCPEVTHPDTAAPRRSRAAHRSTGTSRSSGTTRPADREHATGLR